MGGYCDSCNSKEGLSLVGYWDSCNSKVSLWLVTGTAVIVRSLSGWLLGQL